MMAYQGQPYGEQLNYDDGSYPVSDASHAMAWDLQYSEQGGYYTTTDMGQSQLQYLSNTPDLRQPTMSLMDDSLLPQSLASHYNEPGYYSTAPSTVYQPLNPSAMIAHQPEFTPYPSSYSSGFLHGESQLMTPPTDIYSSLTMMDDRATAVPLAGAPRPGPSHAMQHSAYHEEIKDPPAAPVSGWPAHPAARSRHRDRSPASPYTRRPSRGSTGQAEGAAVRCQWRGCHVPLADISPSGIKRHLQLYHGADAVERRRGDTGICKWQQGNGPCARKMDLLSLGKHIASVHLRSTATRCPHCGMRISREDALKRHIDNSCAEAPSAKKSPPLSPAGLPS